MFDPLEAALAKVAEEEKDNPDFRIGNPYVGLETAKAGSPFSLQLGGRIPLADYGDDGTALLVGFLGDWDHVEAWVPDLIPVPATAAGPTPDVLLLPLVAFDAAGYRLGYGGGYFDRTLAAMHPRPLTIGVGFDLCAVADIRPERHDIPLDLIVTESGIRWVNRP